MLNYQFLACFNYCIFYLFSFYSLSLLTFL